MTDKASAKASPTPSVQQRHLTASPVDPGEGKREELHTWHFHLSGCGQALGRATAGQPPAALESYVTEWGRRREPGPSNLSFASGGKWASS